IKPPIGACRHSGATSWRAGNSSDFDQADLPFIRHMPNQYHFDRLIEFLLKRGATELRIEKGLPPRFYVGSNFITEAGRPFTSTDIQAIMNSITPDEPRSEFEST